MTRQPTARVLSTYELIQKFPDEQSAIDYLSGILWKDGVFCGYCRSKNVKERISKPNFYHCNDCKKDFSIRVGTIFHRSHIPLHKWLYAMYLIVTSRKGISDDIFHCDEALLAKIISNADEWVRKRFSGLRTLLPEISKNKPSFIVDKARKYGINAPIVRSGGKESISIPKDMEEIKKFLAFLNEEMYTGELTGKQYKSNSQIAMTGQDAE